MEIFILKRLSHTRIVKFIEAIEDTDYFYLVMELCGSGNSLGCSPLDSPDQVQLVPELHRRHFSDLFDFIKSSTRQFDESTIKKIFGQLADAVHYLHSNNYVHRDIKDENVMIDEEFNIKLVDFGASDRIPTNSRDYFTSFRGSPRYTPPEMYKSPKHRGPEVDMWCLGILLFTLSYNYQPFATKEDIICHRFVMIPNQPRSEALKDLIKILLESVVSLRAKIEQVLSHPFLSSSL
jgi:serine/threonine protein kinase